MDEQRHDAHVVDDLVQRVFVLLRPGIGKVGRRDPRDVLQGFARLGVQCGGRRVGEAETTEETTAPRQQGFGAFGQRRILGRQQGVQLERLAGELGQRGIAQVVDQAIAYRRIARIDLQALQPVGALTASAAGQIAAKGTVQFGRGHRDACLPQHPRKRGFIGQRRGRLGVVHARHRILAGDGRIVAAGSEPGLATRPAHG